MGHLLLPFAFLYIFAAPLIAVANMQFTSFILATAAAIGLAQADFMVYTVPPIPTDSIPKFTDPAEVRQSLRYNSPDRLTPLRHLAGPSASSSTAIVHTIHSRAPWALHISPRDHPPLPKLPPSRVPPPTTQYQPMSPTTARPRRSSPNQIGTLRCRVARGRSRSSRSQTSSAS